jgi:hypothetical protein
MDWIPAQEEILPKDLSSQLHYLLPWDCWPL